MRALITALAVVCLVANTQAQPVSQQGVEGQRGAPAAIAGAHAVQPTAPIGAIPPWFPKALPLPPPQGEVVRVSTADELLAAVDRVGPGGTILLADGHYQLPRVIVLQGKRDITIRGAAGDPKKATLRGKGWDSNAEGDDLLHIGQCDGVTIADLTFADCRSYGIKVEAERAPKNIHIYNCRFRDIGVRAIKGSAGQDPNTRAVKGSVRYCSFENTKVPPADWLFGGDYISAIDMMALEDWTFSDNFFRNIKGHNGGGRAAIFLWVRSRRLIVERNLIIDCDRGVAFGNPGQSTANLAGERLAYVSDGVIRNNFIVGGADCGIELWYAEQIKVCHNSIWRPERNWNRGIRIGTGTSQTDIVNNLVHGEIRLDGGKAELRQNLTGRLDGYFVDPASGNLALTSAARGAIDQGASVPEVPEDIRRRPRVGRFDLGAWEFDGERTRDPTPTEERLRKPPAELAEFFAPPEKYRTALGDFRSPLLFADGTPVRTPADWQRRRSEILSTWHKLMGPWPPLIEKPRVELRNTTRRENITQQQLRIEIALGGEKVDALLLIPDGAAAARKRPAVLVVYYDAETGVGLGAPLRDYGWQLARRGFVALSIGKPNARIDLTTTNKPRTEPYLGPVGKPVRVEPLSALAYAAANAHTVLAQRPEVQPDRIGIVGHSFGGKWAMVASCLDDRFACAVWSDPGVVFDERDRRQQNPSGSVNYWDVWYLGFDLGALADPPGAGPFRKLPSEGQPRTGAYKALVEGGHDLVELHALLAPRPFLVSGGTADLPERWPALNHAIAVNKILGYDHRVAMTSRDTHTPTEQANEQVYRFFEWCLGDP